MSTTLWFKIVTISWSTEKLCSVLPDNIWFVLKQSITSEASVCNISFLIIFIAEGVPVINRVWCVCVIGLRSWMHWCLAISSLYWLLDWPALSWQRGSRATAIFCPSADALNRPTLKTRAPEGLKITYLSLYHLFSYILSFSHSPDCSPKKLKCLKNNCLRVLSPIFPSLLASCSYIIFRSLRIMNVLK